MGVDASGGTVAYATVDRNGQGIFQGGVCNTGTIGNAGACWFSGAGDPKANTSIPNPCLGGSLYTRTDSTGGLYVCVGIGNTATWYIATISAY
jgi:hypothetical protein